MLGLLSLSLGLALCFHLLCPDKFSLALGLLRSHLCTLLASPLWIIDVAPVVVMLHRHRWYLLLLYCFCHEASPPCNCSRNLFASNA